MRHCTVEDYKKREVKITEKLEKKVLRRICADIPPDFDYFGVKNEDSDEDFRKSISLEVIKCSGKECENK
jgi:hypothetical protein